MARAKDRSKTDRALAGRVRRLLRLDPTIDDSRIIVHTERGAVVLVGEVGTPSTYLRVEDVVRSVVPQPTRVWNALRLVAPSRKRAIYWRPRRPFSPFPPLGVG